LGFLRRLLGIKKFRYDYLGDGIAVLNKNLGFMDDPRFAEAYRWSAYYEFSGRKSAWTGIDTRWRAHICVWAAKQALSLDGDFVECGVDTAILSGAVVKYLNFQETDRQFFLFDTYEGIPEFHGMTDREKERRATLNKKGYFDSFDFVADKMKNFKNVKLVKGLLPDTLSAISDRRIAYLSVDLNNAPSEKAVIETLWKQLVPGAIVVIDDYAFKGFEPQYAVWNDFAKSKNLMVATLPTGQGLLIKAND